MRNTMKKLIIIGTFCILYLCGCINNQKVDFNYTNEEQIEKEIKVNLEELTNTNNTDYKNNEYYNNIIKLGEDAVPVLENMYNNGKLSETNAYISALAIQDITKCNLHEKYNLNWTTAEEFYTLWRDNNCSFKK